MREVNRSIILNMIRLHYPISRAELSERSGIFRSNVSGIVDELINLGLVKEERATPVGRGRVPFHLYLNDHGFRVLGVSIRATRTTVAFAGLAGHIEKTVSMPTPQQPEALVEGVAAAIAGIRGELAPTEGDFEEICVSVPGLVDVGSGGVRWVSALADYTGFPLRAAIEKATGVQTTVDNDCNLGAMAELWLSDREDVPLKDFVFLDIGGFGVGGGMIINHELYRGHDSTFAAEYGHMSVAMDGPKCTCGRRGCLELYVADRATWHRWKPGKRFEPEQFESFIEAARSGDREAVRAAAETARVLAVGISNIVFALNPEVIVIAGRITALWDILEPPVTQALGSTHISVRVRPARLSSEDLFLQGAVTQAASKAFAKPKFGF